VSGVFRLFFLQPSTTKVDLQPPIGSRPSTPADITALSLHFLHGEITSYPFSPAPLSSESQLILPHLLRLAKNGWWPVGSQPAVDGLQSDHGIVGWGPAGGYVYQKSFVEFFASEDIVERLEKAVEKAKGIVDFLAGNKMVSTFLAIFRYRPLTLVAEG
jgi:methylenetetrahydrofolate reductase (NADPH)